MSRENQESQETTETSIQDSARRAGRLVARAGCLAVTLLLGFVVSAAVLRTMRFQEALGPVEVLYGELKAQAALAVQPTRAGRRSRARFGEWTDAWQKRLGRVDIESDEAGLADLVARLRELAATYEVIVQGLAKSDLDEVKSIDETLLRLHKNKRNKR